MKYGSCKECGQEAVIQDDGVSHHISEETGGTDYDQDAKHVAVVIGHQVITVHRLSLQFDNAYGNIHGTIEEMANEAVDRINELLQQDVTGLQLSAQLFATPDEIEVTSEDKED